MNQQKIEDKNILTSVNLKKLQKNQITPRTIQEKKSYELNNHTKN